MLAWLPDDNRSTLQTEQELLMLILRTRKAQIKLTFTECYYVLCTWTNGISFDLSTGPVWLDMLPFHRREWEQGWYSRGLSKATCTVLHGPHLGGPGLGVSYEMAVKALLLSQKVGLVYGTYAFACKHPFF